MATTKFQATRPSEKPTQFVFVPSNGHKVDDEETRRAIRVHVMKDYIDSSNKAAVSKTRAKNSNVTNPGRQMKFKLKSTGLEQAFPYRQRRKAANDAEKLNGPTAADGNNRKQSNTPARSKATISASDRQQLENETLPLSTIPLKPLGRYDPFSNLPVVLNKEDEFLLDHFTRYVHTSWCPINGQGKWFQYAVQDALLFHASLYNWGIHWARSELHLSPRAKRVLHHKSMAVKLINERLNQQGPELLTDVTLAGVAAMANIEIAYGTNEEATIHMVGLSDMVSLRGGLENLGDGIDGLLQRIVGWVDLNYAELYSTSLHFPGEYDWDIVLRESRADYFGLGFQQHGPSIEWPAIDPALLEIFKDVRGIRDIVDAIPTYTLNERQKIFRSDHYHSVERRLRSMAKKCEAQGDIITLPVALAAVLYVHISLRALPLRYRQIGTLVTCLYSSLQAFDNLMMAWVFAPETLTWVLAVGTMTAYKRKERAWFMEWLTKACRGLEIGTYKQFQDTMRTIVWAEGGDPIRYEPIWEEVEENLRTSSFESPQS